jgi:hypothetical protein
VNCGQFGSIAAVQFVKATADPSAARQDDSALGARFAFRIVIRVEW